MNPQYGAAVERARLADEGDDSEVQFEDSSAPQIEYMSSASQQRPSQEASSKTQSSAPPQAQEHKAEVGYGETSGLLSQKSPDSPVHANPYDRRTWDKNSARDLQEARQNIMDISGRNHTVHRAKLGADTISTATVDDNRHAAA